MLSSDSFKPVPAVRIHLAPPPSLDVAAISGERREMTDFVARFERATEPDLAGSGKVDRSMILNRNP
jgi:hypothetical protein